VMAEQMGAAMQAFAVDHTSRLTVSSVVLNYRLKPTLKKGEWR